ncbi:ribbon-helix-helix protein, CopG family [Thalassomonas sp. RHCl1]|uniref:ribbon-helix-helix protein, CopG family n=1 Tax=Thalassomonas sp. RHCl1 TaxID=2995320 RepID=UPI00248BADA0|nr:ribbon-helix-helix protein, CopG family [Thalassomonas sp. RHCl1]
MKKIIVITVRVDSETADAISLLAQTHDRSVAWITRKLITEALEAHKLLKPQANKKDWRAKS